MNLKMANVTILKKKIKYVPFADELYMHKLRLKLTNDKTYLRVLQHNLTDNFISTLRRIVDPNKLFEENFILQISGSTGSGKTAIAMSLCKIVKPENFSHNNFCFYDQQIIELAKTLPRDSFIIRDEGTDKASFGVGSQRTARQLQVFAETTRKHGMNLIFIEPEERQNDIAKYYIETFDMDIDQRITRAALKDNQGNILGGIYIPIVPETDPDWIEYNQHKDEFIAGVIDGRNTESKMDYKELAREMHDQINLDTYSTKGARLIYVTNELTNLTIGEIRMVSGFLELMLKHGRDEI